jgi:hypothetical protein
MSILDAFGKLVQQLPVNSEEQIQVDVQHLATGIYSIQIRLGENLRNFRFVKR